MEKTKLGIAVGLVGAFVCAAVGFGGYVAAAIAVGYVLLFEQNEWLKKTAVKAAATLVVFGFATELIGLVPSAINWVASIINVFGANLYFEFINDVFGVITKFIGIVRDLVFLGLIFKSLNQGTVKVPVVDGIVDKYL